MNEVDAIFKEMQNNMWDAAFAILQILGYLAIPIVIALFIIRFVLRIKGGLFQVLTLLITVGWAWYWSLNIFPKITDLI